MKLIHCSDIHLDSPLERNFTPSQARERNAELCAAFARLVAYACREGVGGILMAGDLFDTERVSPRTVGFVLDTIRGAEHVTFFCLRGNHDSGDPFFGMELPENLKTFGPQWTSYRCGDVVVTGLELDRENCLGMYDSLKLEPGDTNIVLLHGQTGTAPGEETVALPYLRGKQIHYLALGHIHSFRQGRLDEDGIWCYSGCLEGRGFDECGQKGFVLLDVEPGNVTAEFIPFAARTLHEVPVDISDLETLTGIRDAMDRASREIPEGDLVKFILRGDVSVDTQLDLSFLQKQLAGRFWFVRLTDETRLKLDPARYAHDMSLKGEFIRQVLASDRPRAEQERIILLGLRALESGEVVL